MNGLDRKPSSDGAHKFGTFAGVFTPSILTILGVIMFMRCNFVVGQAGILGAIAILLIAKTITVMTAFSIGAISTNTQVRGGGAYFLISRIIGPEFGAAIGLALFVAQALSVPFYILGFTEALVRTAPSLEAYFLQITLIAAAALFILAYIGAAWAIKTQYVIMAVLFLSIVVFMGGAAIQFSSETLAANMDSGYTAIDPEGSAGNYSFWIIFAIYFPAVTGILAGVNMSGDLKDPARSIPLGTLAAVGVGFAVYLLQILMAGGAFARADLIAQPFQVLKNNALFGMGFLVIGGVFAATLSSALGSYLGAPRILQAVSRDWILKSLKPFAKGTPKGDEPRRALVLTGVITVAVLLWAGNEPGGGALNAVAGVISMFFLYTYGMINFAAFVEDFGDNPSFRPTFRIFHWSTALAGAVACVVIAFLIDPLAAIVAVMVIAGLLWYVKTREFRVAFGDARRGFVYAALRRNLVRISRMEETPKNWRPTILVFSGNPATREGLVTYSIWLESGRGIVFLANVLQGTIEEYGPRRQAAVRQLESFCVDKNIQAFPIVVIAEDVEAGARNLLQTVSVGPIRPNLTMFGWTDSPEFADRYVRYLRYASSMGMNLVLLREHGVPSPMRNKRIDLWWRGRKNGGLMIILAHLLVCNWEWGRTEIRILRLVENETGRRPAEQALRSLIEEARLKADVEAIVSDRPFVDILHEYSSDAACLFLGFEIPKEGKELEWQKLYDGFLRDMPTTIMVSSLGDADMLA
ncbi:amino acid permease [Candidatus Hydrogenedentota bacterium]